MPGKKQQCCRSTLKLERSAPNTTHQDAETCGLLTRGLLHAEISNSCSNSNTKLCKKSTSCALTAILSSQAARWPCSLQSAEPLLEPEECKGLAKWQHSGAQASPEDGSTLAQHHPMQHVRRMHYSRPPQAYNSTKQRMWHTEGCVSVSPVCQRALSKSTDANMLYFCCSP